MGSSQGSFSSICGLDGDDDDDIGRLTVDAVAVDATAADRAPARCSDAAPLPLSDVGQLEGGGGSRRVDGEGSAAGMVVFDFMWRL